MQGILLATHAGCDVSLASLFLRCLFLPPSSLACFRSPAALSHACREVPTIMRYLGLFVPDKDFVEKILVELHGDEPSPFIRYEKVEKVSWADEEPHSVASPPLHQHTRLTYPFFVPFIGSLRRSASRSWTPRCTRRTRKTCCWPPSKP